MKNLLIVILLIALVGLFFHDRQQTADLAAGLAAAQDQNAQLTQRIATAQAEAAARPTAAPAAPAILQPSLGSFGGANPLDRGAYKDGH